MPYRVKVSRRASNDVAAVAAWIAERSPDGARRWLAALDAVLEAITRNPDGYPCAEEDNDICEMELRQFLFKTRRGRVYRGGRKSEFFGFLDPDSARSHRMTFEFSSGPQ